MITPNKVIRLTESIIYKMKVLMKDRKEVGVIDLYLTHEKEFDGVDEFLYAVDALYILGYLDVNLEQGTVTYAN